MAAEEPIFCKECPLKGGCKEEVIGVLKEPYEGSRFGTGFFTGTFAALVDETGRYSTPVEVPRRITADELVEAVTDCDGPVYLEKGIIFKRRVPTCKALGQYVIRDAQLRSIAQQVF